MSKQSELRGIERPKIKDIEDACDEYVRVRDKRKDLADDEKANVEKLIIAMRRHKVTRYAYEGQVVTLDEVEKVKVKAADKEDDDEG